MDKRLRITLFVLLFFLLLSGSLWIILDTPLAKVILLEWYKRFDQKSFAAEIDYTINSTLERIGIDGKDIISKDKIYPQNNGIWKEVEKRIKVQPYLVLAVCNLEITNAVKKIGGKVIDAEETRSWNGDKIILKMTIGFSDFITHRLTFEQNVVNENIILKKKLAIIIDDFGMNYDETVKEFIELEIPITISILPNLPASKKIASEANQLGQEVTLHLPMEPKEYPRLNPGKDAILTDLTEKEIRIRVKKCIDSVPYCKGVNNHMGSRATEVPSIMRIVMSEIKNTNMYFVDSLTSPYSVAWRIAHESGIKTAKNLLFIDNSYKTENIKKQLQKVIEISSKRDKTIVIGHNHKNTLKAIKEMIPEFEKEGITLVYASEIVE